MQGAILSAVFHTHWLFLANHGKSYQVFLRKNISKQVICAYYSACRAGCTGTNSTSGLYSFVDNYIQNP
jgi:hypothetical protein